jgi:UDPglucose 6-dehydrogenase
LFPSRVILGAGNQEAYMLIKKIYSAFEWEPEKIKHMSVASSELTKYSSNAFLATKISFMNEMAAICEVTGASIHEVREGMGSDPRIGEHFLYAGLGYGGSCFPKDVSALIDSQKKLNLGPSILEETKRINDLQAELFIEKIYLNIPNIDQCCLAMWGLSFKPNSDDIRESVAIKLVRKLASSVKFLNLYDPISMGNASKELSHLNNINFCDSKKHALSNADALLICTEWDEFKELDASELKLLHNKTIFDGRNILDKADIEASNIKYFGIGV